MGFVGSAARPRRQAVAVAAKLGEKLDGFDEVAAFDDHDEVDGVEVFLTAEAARKIRFALGSGVKLLAAWTKKAEVTLGDLHGQVEGVEDPGDGQVIAQRPEELTGESLGHGLALRRRYRRHSSAGDLRVKWPCGSWPDIHRQEAGERRSD